MLKWIFNNRQFHRVFCYFQKSGLTTTIGRLQIFSESWKHWKQGAARGVGGSSSVQGHSQGTLFYAVHARAINTDLSTNVEISEWLAFVGPQLSAKTDILLVLRPFYRRCVPGIFSHRALVKQLAPGLVIQTPLFHIYFIFCG